jgi:hypothetical protein
MANREQITNDIYDSELYIKIIEELNDDLDRYDGDYDTWSEVALDCPSNTLVELLKKVPEDQVEEMNVLIQQHIQSLGE